MTLGTSGTGSGSLEMTCRGSESLRERRITWFPKQGAAGYLCQTRRARVRSSQGTWRLGDTEVGGGASLTSTRGHSGARNVVILGRVADQGRMWLSPRPRKAVVLGQEMHRSLQGAGVLHARSGPQGPSGVEAPAGQPRGCSTSLASSCVSRQEQVPAFRCHGLPPCSSLVGSARVP